MTPQFAAWVDRARVVDIGEIIVQRGIRLRGRGQAFAGRCPVCGGRDRFGIHTGRQLFNCRGCGGRGRGAVSLVMFLDQCDFVGAVTCITGEPPPKGHADRKPDPEREQRIAADRKRRELEQQDDEAKRLRRADVIWGEAVPIAGTPGEEYLALRGINIADVPDYGGLRFHSHCPWGNGRQPCIVARFTHTVTGAALGIHRRPISIPGAKPMSIGAISGGIIRLWPDDSVSTGLVVGEGIETTLAAATRVTHHGTLLQPAWACGSATALEALPPLAGIEELTILSDHDASGTGQKAAERCGERWAEAGCRVVILTPGDVGIDFNDLVRWMPMS